MHSAVKWIILVAEMLVPLLHFVAPLVLFVLAGIDIAASLVVVPLVTHNDVSARTAILQTNELLDKLSRYVRPTQHAFVVLFFIMGFFSLRHSDAAVHWRMPYHVISLVIMCQIVWYDLALMLPLERRIRALQCGTHDSAAAAAAAAAAATTGGSGESEGGVAIVVVGGAAAGATATAANGSSLDRDRDRQRLSAVEGRWEAVRLLHKWEWRQRVRLFIPLLAAIVSLAGFASRGPAW